ncbi:hypothetical protein KK101_01885 [Curtobacterium flaccumfaciens pv. oortii]|nr:hypothetical protein [Curtobacterium flaccumfaciens pv. oortii]
MPKNKGGDGAESNITLACPPCNLSKGAKDWPGMGQEGYNYREWIPPLMRKEAQECRTTPSSRTRTQCSGSRRSSGWSLIRRGTRSATKT